ncbi:MAG: TRAP transporter substrate-binding protein [Lentisphaerae bacterium]|jgi:TRAP-type C4-dicarboxylate transport system substrate-binding protein|nr:TRAP transporter substrate-binding protein [Lentisphaerota bacterium]
MMKKVKRIRIRRIVLLSTALLLLAFALSCSFLSSSGSRVSSEGVPAQYRLTYNIFFPASHGAAKLGIEWAREVEKRTGGRVAVDVYPGSVLTTDSENFNGVVFGATDLGMSCFAYSRGLFPLIEALDLPWGYRDGMMATEVANEFIRKFQPEELADVELMYAHAHGPGILASNEPVRTFADIQHQRLRGTGVTARAIGHLGADAVGLSQGDTYEALRKGVVQGTLCPIETLCGWKQGEVVKTVTKIPALGYTTAMFVVMNRKSWEKLPEDIRAIISEINQEWIRKHGELWDAMDAEGEAYVRDRGKEIVEFGAEDNAQAAEALRPLLDGWAAGAKAKGLPGDEAVAFLRTRVSGQSIAAAKGTDNTKEVR